MKPHHWILLWVASWFLLFYLAQLDRARAGDVQKQEALCKQHGGMVLRTQSGLFCWTELK